MRRRLLADLDASSESSESSSSDTDRSEYLDRQVRKVWKRETRPNIQRKHKMPKPMGVGRSKKFIVLLTVSKQSLSQEFIEWVCLWGSLCLLKACPLARCMPLFEK